MFESGEVQPLKVEPSGEEPGQGFRNVVQGEVKIELPCLALAF